MSAASSLLASNLFIPRGYSVELNVDPRAKVFTGEAAIQLTQSTTFTQEKLTTAATQGLTVELHASQLAIRQAHFCLVPNSLLELRESINDLLPLPDDDSLLLKLKAAARLIPPTNSVVFSLESEPSQQLCEFLLGYADSHVLILSVSYLGTVSLAEKPGDATDGLFRCCTDGNWLLASHFQPFAGRRLLPCIDEPAARAVFQLNVLCDESYTAVSCMPVRRVVPETANGRNKHVWCFQPTPPTSVNVLGLAVGLLLSEQSSEAEPAISVYFLPGRESVASRALCVLRRSVSVLTELLGLPFPLPKVDLAILPQLADGAMENWGLLTCSEAVLGFFDRSETPAVARRMHDVLTHILVHQWFGNYFSFDSWQGMWLNEAFATWLAAEVSTCCATQLPFAYPDAWLNSDAECDAALDRDVFGSADGAGTIVARNNSAAKTKQEVYDMPAYHKGLRLLRMFSAFVDAAGHSGESGESGVGGQKQQGMWLKAVAAAIRQLALQAVRPFEFWRAVDAALEAAGQPKIGTAVAQWTKTEGFPIICVTYEPDSHSIKLVQHRYFAEEFFDGQNDSTNASDTVYPIPLVVQTTEGQRTLMFTERTVELPLEPSERLLSLNPHRTGFFRVHYSVAHHTEDLTEHLSKLSEDTLVGMFKDAAEFLARGVFVDVNGTGSGSGVLTEFCRLAAALAAAAEKAEKGNSKQENATAAPTPLAEPFLWTAICLFLVQARNYVLGSCDTATCAHFKAFVTATTDCAFRSFDWTTAGYFGGSAPQEEPAALADLREALLRARLDAKDTLVVYKRGFSAFVSGGVDLGAFRLSTLQAVFAGAVYTGANQEWTQLHRVAFPGGSQPSGALAEAAAESLAYTREAKLVEKTVKLFWEMIRGSAGGAVESLLTSIGYHQSGKGAAHVFRAVLARYSDLKTAVGDAGKVAELVAALIPYECYSDRAERTLQELRRAVKGNDETDRLIVATSEALVASRRKCGSDLKRLGEWLSQRG